MLTEQQIIQAIPELKKYARKLSKNNYEDLLQDVLLRAWTKRSLYDPLKGKAKKWLFCMMHNLYIEQSKKSPVMTFVVNDIDTLKTKSLRRYNPNQEHKIAFKQAQKLPNFDLALANALGYSLEDITEQLEEGQGISIGRTCLYNNIQKFRSHKEEYI